MTTIRPLEQKDIKPVVDLMELYHKESLYHRHGVPGDRPTAEYLIELCLTHDGLVALVCEDDDGALTGCAILAFEHGWLGLACQVEMFMVSPERRHRGIGVRLRDRCLDEITARGATVVRTAAESGLSAENTALYEKLWEKAGFAPLGRVMVFFPQATQGA